MLLSSDLQDILSQELVAGNVLAEEHVGKFENCRVLIVLKYPFQVDHSIVQGVEGFTNRDDHFPVGKGYKDHNSSEILMAPLVG